VASASGDEDFQLCGYREMVAGREDAGVHLFGVSGCVSRSSGSPNNDDECNKKRNDEKEKNKVKAHVAENLLYRHWTHWNEGSRAHLFVIAPDGSGEARDLTAGANYDVPPISAAKRAMSIFLPILKEICFTAVTDKVEATSTNGDLFTVPVAVENRSALPRSPGLTAIQCTRRMGNTLHTTRN